MIWDQLLQDWGIYERQENTSCKTLFRYVTYIHGVTDDYAQ